MRYFLFLIISTLLSCQPKSSVNPGPSRTEAAFISDNYLYVDGCESYVRLGNQDSTRNSIFYKPTGSTLPILQKAVTTIPAIKNSAERAVTVRFAETGNKVTLLCGWVNKPQIDEIEILEITAR